MQQTHDDDVGVRGGQGVESNRQRALAERTVDRAISENPLVHLEAHRTRHELPWLDELCVEEPWAGATRPTNLDQIAKSPGIDDRDLGALGLQHRVRRNRRAMNDAPACR